MKRLLVLLVILGAISAPTGAHAWSNGTDGCNSYGTHDLILDKALDMLGDEASWVHRRVALRATDGPDCQDGLDHASSPWWHVYDRWGETYGGADEAAQVWFRRVKKRLASDATAPASWALGVLAHIVGDVAQPMHTDSRAREDRVHPLYEAAVDRRVDEYRFRFDGRDTVKPRARTVRLARGAHVYYFDLVRVYDRHSYNSKVHRITRRQLDRAANALADLISALTL